MILRNLDIQHAIEQKNLGIEPFLPTQLKGASYMFTLAEKILIPKQVKLLDVDQELLCEEVVMGVGGYHLHPQGFVLGFTKEKLSLQNNFVCLFSARGSCAQAGLNLLLTSTLAEPDTDSQIKIEIHNLSQSPILLKPGLKIVKGIFIPV